MAILHSPAERRYCSERGLPLVDRPAHERLREMFLFINYIHLSASSCARTHKRMLSWIPQSAGFTVWDMGEWEKDDWDATDYGRPYDFNRPFFDQFDELFRAVPIYNLSNVVATMENSEFTNCIVNAKNSYLCFECNGIEDSLYCFSMHKCRDAIESTSVARSELCYRCFNIADCYNVLFVEDSSGCSDSAFLSNCIGCKHCFGCVNLTRREFCYFNEQLSAEEYRRRIVSHALDTTAGLTGTRFAFEKFVATFPKRAAFVSQCADSSGNLLARDKNCMNCYSTFDCEDCDSCVALARSKSGIFHAGYGEGSELVYQSVHCGDSAYDIQNCFESWMNVRSLEYCGFCAHSTMDCFGCVSLKRKRYCILNQQYTKDEYEALVPRIKEHMSATGEYGHFFPPHLSPHAYNLSAADIFFPLTRERAEGAGYRWEEPAVRGASSLVRVPSNLADFADDDIELTFHCTATDRPFKVTTKELLFYRQMQVAPPSTAPMTRLRELTQMHRVRPLRAGTCASCSTAIRTIWPATESSYCEGCFEKALVE